jgi:elongation factor P
VGTYKTSDFKKGLKVQIDGEPYLMTEMNFRKPGKGNALYECKLRNLVRGTTLTRTYKGGDELESADITEVECQFLYNQQDTFFFMNNQSFEQYEIPKDKIEDTHMFLKDGMPVSVLLFNDKPISITPPSHVVLKVAYCEPGARGDTATNVTKTLKLETGAEIIGPAFVNIDDMVKVDTRTGEYIERVRD